MTEGLVAYRFSKIKIVGPSHHLALVLPHFYQQKLLAIFQCLQRRKNWEPQVLALTFVVFHNFLFWSQSHLFVGHPLSSMKNSMMTEGLVAYRFSKICRSNLNATLRITWTLRALQILDFFRFGYFYTLEKISKVFLVSLGKLYIKICVSFYLKSPGSPLQFESW